MVDHHPPAPGATTFSPEVASDTLYEDRKREFLQDLPADTNQYRYPGFEGLEAIIFQDAERCGVDHLTNHCIIFTDVPEEDIDKHGEWFPKKLDYSSELRILIIEKPGTPHEEIAQAFQAHVLGKAREVGVLRKIRIMGSSTYDTSRRKKGPDCCYGPFTGSASVSPTVVVEVDSSETVSKLKKDVTWWLNVHGTKVQRAISIEINRQSGSVYITAWERGASPTLQEPNPEPLAVERVKISPSRNGNQPYIDGNKTTIPLQQLLLREPVAGEGDILLGEPELLDVAERMWYTLDMLRPF